MPLWQRAWEEFSLMKYFILSLDSRQQIGIVTIIGQNLVLMEKRLANLLQFSLDLRDSLDKNNSIISSCLSLWAISNGVLPNWSLKFILRPWFNRYSTLLIFPEKAAKCNGVLLVSSRGSFWHPTWNKYWRILISWRTEAWWTGVHPKLSAQFLFWVAFHINSTISRFPIKQTNIYSLEIRSLCLMKWPSEMLQNLPYFWNTKTHVVFFISHFVPLYSSSYWMPWSMLT